LFFILWYFVVYPIRLERKMRSNPAFAEKLNA
jgi:hypothetical protein